jgi:hypothetical protein
LEIGEWRTERGNGKAGIRSGKRMMEYREMKTRMGRNENAKIRILKP